MSELSYSRERELIVDLLKALKERRACKKHNCPEWDYLEICEDDPEFDACLCFRDSSLSQKDEV